VSKLSPKITNFSHLTFDERDIENFFEIK